MNHFIDAWLSPAMAPVTIVLEKAVRIRGRVVDPDGNPAAGATAAPALTGSGNSLTGDARFSVTTGPDGTFEMELPASNGAEYNLVAHDGTYKQWRKWANGTLPPIRTAPGQEIEGVEIRLTRPAAVRGLVVDERGKPVPYREVRAQAADKRENRYYGPTVKTNEDGAFELPFIRPGKQYIQAAPFWMTAEQGPKDATKTVTLDAGQTVEGIKLIIYYYNQGFTAEMLLCQFPTLELALVHKVIVFYLEHRDEVDRYVTRYRTEIDRFRASSQHAPSVAELRKRLEAGKLAEPVDADRV